MIKTISKFRKALEKSEGSSFNVDTKYIKLSSALLRMLTNTLNKQGKREVSTEVHGCGQFAEVVP